MTPQEIVDILKNRFPTAVAEAAVEGLHPSVSIAPEQWHAVAVFLRDDARLAMNMLRCISGLDLHPDAQTEVVYDLMSMRPPDGTAVSAARSGPSPQGGGRGSATGVASPDRPAPLAADGLWHSAGMIAIRVRVPREGGHVPSVADVWPTANWHEREAFDLLGVTFDGHPDLRRILCPDDWVGHPLRKDYEFPKEYEGIPAAAAAE